MFTLKKIGGGFAAILAGLMLAGAALAVDEDMDTAPASGNAASVPLYSGGVGDDDLDYIKGIEHRYDLKVMFTETNGVFLADLPVSIRDSKGREIVSTVTKGPILLVNLPAGNYTISASRHDVNREEKISVRANALRRLDFRFPGNDMRSPG